jgi:pyrroline-5-carboxylate reductase
MTRKETKLAIVGTGNLGRALAVGLIDAGVDPGRIIATRRHISAIADLADKGIMVTDDNLKAARESDIILLCVKPYNYKEVLEEILPALGAPSKILVSVVSGVGLKDLKSSLPDFLPVFRAMPNTAADINESLTCISHNGEKQDAVDSVYEVFNAIGKTVEIDENLMNSATVLGACGIAYVMRFIRAMVQGGIEIGFDAKTASAIVQQTVKGAASLLQERNNHPESEIDKVTTPKGCTIAGLNEMEHHGFSSALIKGLKASMQQIEND